MDIVSSLRALAAAHSTCVSGGSVELRAYSLLDICGWDLAGKLCNEPVWRLLGGKGESVPALVVGGYRRVGETDADVGRRVRDLAVSGIRLVKVPAEPTNESTLRLVKTIREIAGDQIGLVLDLEGESPGPGDVIELGLALEELPPVWMEDPFPPSEVEATADVRRDQPVPLAAGDEGTLDQLRELIRASAVDIVRADATTAGGISGLGTLERSTREPISFHVYPEIHRHLAFASGGEGGIEMFLPGDPHDAVHAFVDADAMDLTADGCLTAPVTPGLGFRIRADIAAYVQHDEIVEFGR